MGHRGSREGSSVTLQGSTGLTCQGGLCREFFGTMGEDVSANEIRRRARNAGWTRKRRDGKLVDLCPKCKGKP